VLNSSIILSSRVIYLITDFLGLTSIWNWQVDLGEDNLLIDLRRDSFIVDLGEERLVAGLKGVCFIVDLGGEDMVADLGGVDFIAGLGLGLYIEVFRLTFFLALDIIVQT
jgi:hypothetical protein